LLLLPAPPPFEETLAFDETVVPAPPPLLPAREPPLSADWPPLAALPPPLVLPSVEEPPLPPWPACVPPVPPLELLLHAAKSNKAQPTIVDVFEKASCRYVMATSEILG
jgi:hypothetical protein